MIEDAIIDKNAKIGTDVAFLRGVWKKGGPTMILEFTSGWSLGRGQECGRTVRNEDRDLAVFILRQRMEVDMRA